MNNDNLKKSFKIFNIEENEVYNEEIKTNDINFNSLYDIFDLNKNNDELVKENIKLKNKLKLNKSLILNIYSIVREFNNKFDNIIKDFKHLLEDDNNNDNDKN